jgi:peroxiredoxin/thiol-disulfide isomerase/thioredoxin
MNREANDRYMTQGPLLPGTPAPDFTLYAAPEESVSLSDYRGESVVLAFYPADWSPLCVEQLKLFSTHLSAIQSLHSHLLGISVDGAWCHLSFAREQQLQFPLLADFEPKGAVARAFGVYRMLDGTSEHALFVIDAGGVVRWSHLAPAGVDPGFNDLLAVLRSLAGASEERPAPQDMPQLTPPLSSRDHAQGPENAAVNLVEFGDYECPYCAEAYPVVKEIQRLLGQQLRYVFRHFPLANLHPHARHAAEAAEAAAAQGRFWDMHALLYERQAQLDDEHLLQYARELGLDVERFRRDLGGHAYAHRVDEDAQSARHSRVSGTPTFFINGQRHDDTFTLEVLLPAIIGALGSH